MPEPLPIRPRNYFLNEAHQLPIEEKSGGGRTAHYLGVDWVQKSQRLVASLEKVERRAASSPDPLSRHRYYILADPVTEVIKESKAKDAKDGRKTQGVDYRGEQSKVFGRLGLDLIEVHPNGAATVHALPERMEQLRMSTAELSQLGLRDQAHWVTIEDFAWLPGHLKFDQEWLETFGRKPVEAYIKFQPLIGELEAEKVIRALADFFRNRQGLSLNGKGRSYLGRFFLRTMIDAPSVRELAENFTSIQSIHPPIIALVESLPPDVTPSSARSRPEPIAPNLARSLPCVAVVDTAVPDEHRWLQPLRRGIVRGLHCLNTENDHHGSMVASRVVFGDADLSQGAPAPTCAFFEVRVGRAEKKILAESVVDAMRGVVIAAPDVRVFNLSFDGESRLDNLPSKQRAETLKLIEELDNFAFDQDVLVVTAAGNAPRGLVPTPDYPHHLDDPGWELHSFPRAFNALTCGGTIARLSALGMGSEQNAPSPFTRIGPGFARSPKPDFCAPAGDTDTVYQAQPGLGVWGYNALGDPREDFGTSFAAPLLAREAAFVLEELRRVCPGDARPFACMAKAVLALSADDCGSYLGEALQPLAQRTLGFGSASVQEFRAPNPDKAHFFWQGVIEHRDDMVRVQLPVPRDWVSAAAAPRLRICASWDTPVNAAVEMIWACRDLHMTLRAEPEGKPLSGSRERVPGYPLFRKTWTLEKCRDRFGEASDLWTIEFTYEQLADPSAGHQVPGSMRIAFAAELWDAAEEPLDPHRFVQALPIAATFLRLSNTAAWLPQSITITADL
jgi:hypothetical protein